MVQRNTDNFPARWRSLTDGQRRFLLAAYEMDKDLPHSDGFDKVLPLLPWRTVGAMCGLKAAESDDVVRALSGLNLLYVVDGQKREFGLTCGHHLRELLGARRKRRWNWIVLAVATLTVMVRILRS